MGNDFFEHRERFGSIEGQAGGIVPKMGVTLTVIGRVRGRRPQIILNILDAKPWKILEISTLVDLKCVSD